MFRGEVDGELGLVGDEFAANGASETGTVTGRPDGARRWLFSRLPPGV